MSNSLPVSAWLSVLRISNAPTVISQVLTGVAIGMYTHVIDTYALFGLTVLVGVGILLSYLAGMVLNDAFDARIDAVERPSRPIPSGRISLFIARFVGGSMLLVGIGMLAVASPATFIWALVLGVCIVAYDILHSLSAGSFLLIASCRALVPIIAAFAVNQHAEWSLLSWVAVGSFTFIAAVSIAARNEMVGFGAVARAASWVLVVATCVPVAMWYVAGVCPNNAWFVAAGLGSIAIAVSLVMVGIRTASGAEPARCVPVAVATWIGAIPAMDAATCFLLGRPILAALCLGMLVVARTLRPRFAGS